MTTNSVDNLDILLVEDDRGHANLMLARLERFGRVKWAESLTIAKELTAGIEFDLLVLDQHLPDGTGVEFLAWTRQQSASKEVNAIIVSTDIDAVHSAEAAGAIAFVEKTEGYLGRLVAAVESM